MVVIEEVRVTDCQSEIQYCHNLQFIFFQFIAMYVIAAGIV